MPITFVLPTRRLQYITETLDIYLNNFRQFGHEQPRVIIFDDSSQEQYEKYFPVLSRYVKDHGLKNIFYVGDQEKKQCKNLLAERLGSHAIPTLYEMCKPSYGGNRTFTLLYTLGSIMVSVDDDFRPRGLIAKNPKEKQPGQILTGTHFHKSELNKFASIVSTDVLGGYLETVGKTVGEVRKNGGYVFGDALKDSMTDLLTNKTFGGHLGDNLVTLINGNVPDTSLIVTAQTYRCGSADVDAIDYFNDFLSDPEGLLSEDIERRDMSMKYVIYDAQPVVTNANWRLDCGISAYDNTIGLPPFIPTILRFEDYGFRLWLQKDGLAAAHTPAIQTHYRNPLGRLGLAHDLWNETISNYLKDCMRNNIQSIDDYAITFADIPVSPSKEFMKEKLNEALQWYEKSLYKASEVSKEVYTGHSPNHYPSLYMQFAESLCNSYNNFDYDHFAFSISKVCEDEYAVIRNTNKIRPTILSIAKDLQLPIRNLSQ